MKSNILVGIATAVLFSLAANAQDMTMGEKQGCINTIASDTFSYSLLFRRALEYASKTGTPKQKAGVSVTNAGIGEACNNIRGDEDTAFCLSMIGNAEKIYTDRRKNTPILNDLRRRLDAIIKNDKNPECLPSRFIYSSYKP